MINEITEILIDVLELEYNNKGKADPNELLFKLDSLQFLNFIVELESKYNISIEPEEMEIIKDIDTILHIIEQKKKF